MFGQFESQNNRLRMRPLAIAAAGVLAAGLAVMELAPTKKHSSPAAANTCVYAGKFAIMREMEHLEAIGVRKPSFEDAEGSIYIPALRAPDICVPPVEP